MEKFSSFFEKIENSIKEVLEEFRELKEKSIALVEAKNRWESVYNDRMVSVKALEDAIGVTQETINGTYDQLNEANTMIEDLMGHKEKLEEALNERSSLIAKLEEDSRKIAFFQVILAATMRTESEGDLENLRATVANLQYEFQDREALLSRLKEQVNSLKSRLMDVSSKLAKYNKKIQQSEAVIENLNYILENIRIQQENQLKELSAAKAEALAQWKQQAGILRENLEAKILEGTEQLQLLKDQWSASVKELEELMLMTN